jgi:hypothetical protein
MSGRRERGHHCERTLEEDVRTKGILSINLLICFQCFDRCSAEVGLVLFVGLENDPWPNEAGPKQRVRVHVSFHAGPGPAAAGHDAGRRSVWNFRRSPGPGR